MNDMYIVDINSVITNVFGTISGLKFLNITITITQLITKNQVRKNIHLFKFEKKNCYMWVNYVLVYKYLEIRIT